VHLVGFTIEIANTKSPSKNKIQSLFNPVMFLEHFSFFYLPPKFCKHGCFCPPMLHVQYICLRFNYLNNLNLYIHLSTTGSENKVSCNHYLMTRRRKIVIHYTLWQLCTHRNNLWHPVEDKISQNLCRHGKDEKYPNTPAGMWLQIFEPTDHYLNDWRMAPSGGVEC